MNIRFILLRFERYWTWKTVLFGIGLASATVAVFNPYYLWDNLRYTLTRPQTGAVEAAGSTGAAAELRVADLPVVGIRNSDLSALKLGLGRSIGADSDGDGLADALESAIGTKAGSADSDGDGYDDRTEIVNGYDPLGPGDVEFNARLAERLSGKYLIQVEAHGELWYVDPSDRKRYLVPVESGKVTAVAQLPAKTSGSASAPTAQPTQSKAYEPDMLYVPSLRLAVPVQYVREATEQAFQSALAKGVVQYPGTAMPGSYGNMYIFGHSSDYKWAKGSYKTVFAVLPRIKVGAEVTVTDRFGTPYTYIVKETVIAKATDTQYLSQYGFESKLLTLQTSYPIGTALKRYIVVAELKD